MGVIGCSRMLKFSLEPCMSSNQVLFSLKRLYKNSKKLKNDSRKFLEQKFSVLQSYSKINYIK